MDDLKTKWAPAFTRPGAVKTFAVGTAALALAALLAQPAAAQVSQLGPLVERSQPNPVGAP
jgi:hypothetical protein